MPHYPTLRRAVAESWGKPSSAILGETVIPEEIDADEGLPIPDVQFRIFVSQGPHLKKFKLTKALCDAAVLAIAHVLLEAKINILFDVWIEPVYGGRYYTLEDVNKLLEAEAAQKEKTDEKGHN
jgi:hypothetical protein